MAHLRCWAARCTHAAGQFNTSLLLGDLGIDFAEGRV